MNNYSHEILLDLETLAQMKADLPGNMLVTVLDAFMRELTEHAPHLKAARAHAQWNVLAHLAHALKSPAGTFGAKRLYRLCSALEQACLTEQLTLASHLADALPAVLADSIEALRAYLATLQ